MVPLIFRNSFNKGFAYYAAFIQTKKVIEGTIGDGDTMVVILDEYWVSNQVKNGFYAILLISQVILSKPLCNKFLF